MPDLDTTVFAFPAQIVTPRTSAAALMDLAKERASDPKIFDTYTPYFWPARISTDRLDAYFTRMRPSSLKNYAAEAAAGVAFQDSHKTDGLVRTLGHSLTGSYAGAQGNGIAHTEADFYTVMGMDPAIDGFVNKMRAGIVRDVSIGFYGGTYMCSICNQALWPDGDCFHYPGISYSVKDESGTKTGQKALCTADIEDAHLAEVSGVYDGATPGAVILKAQRDAADGRIRPDAARLLEARYRIHLPITTSHAGIELPAPAEDNPMPEPAEPRVTTIDSDALRALLAEANIATDDIADGMRQLITENARLRPLAADGETYRKSRQDRAWSEYVRFCAATGQQIGDGAEEKKRAMLERLPIADVDATGDAWQQVADVKLGGGRQTVDTSERDDASGTSGGAHPVSRVPDAAYRTR